MKLGTRPGEFPLSFAKYVRNHLLSLPDIGFDIASEFWSDDYATIAELMACRRRHGA
jgi:hypothetical protein